VSIDDACISLSDGSSVGNPNLSERTRSPPHGIYGSSPVIASAAKQSIAPQKGWIASSGL
jgi:hypothetical protein